MMDDLTSLVKIAAILLIGVALAAAVIYGIVLSEVFSRSRPVDDPGEPKS